MQAGRLTGADKIDKRSGKVIGKHKVAKHFLSEVTDFSFTYSRDENKISAEVVLDGTYGIYVIRTSVADETPQLRVNGYRLQEPQICRTRLPHHQSR